MKQYPTGMVFKQFKIGDHFWTATGRWTCTDIGTRVVIAKRDGTDTEMIFDKYDFDGCSKTEFKVNFGKKD